MIEIAQHNYPKTQKLTSLLLSGDLDENRYLIRNNLLFYKVQPNELKLFVPKISRFDLLRLFHGENCHVGFKKTLQKFREHFWFHSMAAYFNKYLRHCLVCRKGRAGPKQGYLHKTPIPFHTIPTLKFGLYRPVSTNY